MDRLIPDVMLGTKSIINYLPFSAAFADVKLVSVEGVEYPLNRAVLATCSDLFRTILNGVTGNDDVIIKTEVNATDLAMFYEFVLSGILPVDTLYPTLEETFVHFGLDLKTMNLEITDKSTIPVSKIKVEDATRIVQTKLEVFDEEDMPLKQDFDDDLLDFPLSKVEDFDFDEDIKLVKRKYTKRSKNRKQHKDLFYFPQEGSRDESLKFQCTKCVRGFNARESLLQHLYRHDAKDHSEVWACLLCDGKVKFESYKEMREHKASAHSDLSLECPHCGKTFMYKKYLLNHIKIHLDPSQWHVCICCGKKFDLKKDLKMHVRRRGKYHNDKCAQCPDVQFESWADHQAHVRKVHDGVFVSRCKFCPKFFNSDTEKRRHHTRSHNVNSVEDPSETWRQKVVCEHCGKPVFKAHLSKHVESVHGTKNLQCDQCTSVFKHEYALKRHVKERHTMMTCEVCGKIFALRSYKQHFLRKHTPEHLKPFKCTICEPLRGFISSQDLGEHMNTHTMDRPHVCHLCSAAFRSTGNLFAHIRGTHKGIKRIKK